MADKKETIREAYDDYIESYVQTQNELCNKIKDIPNLDETANAIVAYAAITKLIEILGREKRMADYVSEPAKYQPTPKEQAVQKIPEEVNAILIATLTTDNRYKTYYHAWPKRGNMNHAIIDLAKLTGDATRPLAQQISEYRLKNPDLYHQALATFIATVVSALTDHGIPLTDLLDVTRAITIQKLIDSYAEMVSEEQ